jgi:PAS domain S-box-containing protein
MHFRYFSYLNVLIASAMVAVVLWAYARRHRRVRGATALSLLMLVGAVWSLCNALEMAGTDLPTKLFWANAQYLCYTTAPVVWLVLSLQHTGRAAWLTSRRIAWLSVEPLITIALVWTNAWHGLIQRNVSLDTAGPFPVIAKAYGPWFWVHALYTYALIAASVVILLRTARRAAPLYRWQTLLLLAGVLFPMMWNGLYILGRSPVRRFDVAPAMLSFAGLPVAWALFRYRLFDIVPVARDTIIEGMGDGVLVLDAQKRVVDLNPAAQRILGQTASAAIGKPLEGLLRTWPEALELSRKQEPAQVEFATGSGKRLRYCEMRLSPLSDRRGEPLGDLLILHDSTERKLAQAQLLQQQRALAALEERERLARELHDSVAQVLGYVNLQVQAARELLAGGQTSQADAYLARLADVAQDAHADVREYISSLKAATSLEQGLFLALTAYLRRFEQNYGIHTEVVAPHGLSEDALAPAAKVQLLRIIQEALANVRKHALAARARVVLSPQVDQWQVMIEDDGQGFDATQTSDRDEAGFGLRIMRERAEEVGGSLQIHSTPGQGTQVIVQLPLRKEG